jgi:membrane associated rhomboid family serine protease
MLPLRDSVPGRTTPFVTIGLIAANVVLWFWELRSPGVDVHVFRDGFYPCALSGPCHVQAPFAVHPLPWYEGVFTGMFMHASWQHILGNMLFFWIFGNNVEDALGHVRYLFWYLAAGVVAMGVQSAVTLEFSGVHAASIPNIGASGAIAGILGAYFVLLPRSRVLTLIFFGIILIREISAVWFLGVWFALQAWTGGLSLVHPQAGGGVALFAHIGGFAFGVVTGLVVAATHGRPRVPPPRYPAGRGFLR